MRIAVTRPEEDGEKLVHALRARGHDTILAPMLKIEMLPPPDIDARNWQAVIGTSANSFLSLLQHPKRNNLIGLPCACVGPASAQAAQQLGFRQIYISGGGLPELTALLAREFHAGGGPLLYVSGETVSGDLQVPGLEIARVVTYRAIPASHLPDALVAAMRDGTLSGVFLYSPRSAHIWAKLVEQAGLSSEARNVLHYCLSANVAAALPKGTPVKIAAAPLDAEMLALTEADAK